MKRKQITIGQLDAAYAAYRRAQDACEAAEAAVTAAAEAAEVAADEAAKAYAGWVELRDRFTAQESAEPANSGSSKAAA